MDANAFELEQLHQRKWLKFEAPTYPEERLIACYNMSLATQRKHRRQELLEDTEAEFVTVLAATQRQPTFGTNNRGLPISHIDISIGI